jgi:hypothetical protein
MELKKAKLHILTLMPWQTANHYVSMIIVMNILNEDW